MLSNFAMYRPTERLASTLAVAQDGSRLAYIDDQSGQFNVVIRSLTDGTECRVTKFADLAAHDVTFDPRADWVYFFADREGDENTQLYRVSVAGDREPELLTASPDATFEAGDGPGFSPDGRWFALAGNDRVASEQDILILDTQDGSIRRVLVGDGLPYAGHWSPDSRYLTVLEWRSTRSDQAVHVIDVATGEVKLLTDPAETASYDVGPWLPDGSGFLAATNVGREFAGLALIAPDSGELTWWDTPDWDVQQVALAPDGSTAAWVILRDSADVIRVRALATGETWDVPHLPLCSLTHLSLSPTGSHALAMVHTGTRPTNIARIDLRSGAIDWITQVAPAAADPASFVEPSVVTYPSPGTAAGVAALLYRPAVDRPAAMVISIHGGPNSTEVPEYRWDGLYQYLAAHGVGVLAPNFRGSVGYGRQHEDALNRDWGGADLDDFASAAAYLRTLDWVAPDRIGVFGQSYGGFAVLSCLSRLPEIGWRAGVDICGPANLHTLVRSTPASWHHVTARLIGDPERDADLLRQRSPLTYADRISAPLLVIQGANDPRVPQAESDQIVEHVRANGGQVDYHLFPDEGHVFTRRENQEQALTLAAEFLLRHLTAES
ncbi:S9 family peptidase [Krasilnikovia sp. MM14-A1259]